jgi:hypothetical protein
MGTVRDVYSFFSLNSVSADSHTAVHVAFLKKIYTTTKTITALYRAIIKKLNWKISNIKVSTAHTARPVSHNFGKFMHLSKVPHFGQLNSSFSLNTEIIFPHLGHFIALKASQLSVAPR